MYKVQVSHVILVMTLEGIQNSIIWYFKEDEKDEVQKLGDTCDENTQSVILC